MTHYRLLRDNKETGPFSEEEMITKGFKPYDLIWVEGKSAGWRYPSEIPSFKSFAPVVEEQPYDRFYKKQPPQKLFALEEKTTHSYQPAAHFSPASKPVDTMLPLPVRPVPQTLPDYSGQQPTIQGTPGRHIHVTLPSGNTVNLTTVVAKKETREINEAVVETNKIPAYTTPMQAVKAVQLQEESRSSVNEGLGNMAGVAGENGLYSRAPGHILQPASAGFSWTLIAASVIGIATLIGLGIMIGLAMNRDKNEMAFNEALRYKSKQVVKMPANQNNKQSPITGSATATVANQPVQQSSSGSKDLVQNAVVKTTINPVEANAKEIKKLPEVKSNTDKNNAAVADEAAIHNKPLPIVNVEKSLSLTASDFKTGAFGGISGLKYTLFNGSKFALASVEVEVDYVQANNRVFKTERLLFSNISAGAQLTLDVPPSNRGVKISSRIIRVNAKDAVLANTTAKS